MGKDKDQSRCFTCTESNKPCSLNPKREVEPAKRKRDESNVAAVPSKRVRVAGPTTPSPSPVSKTRRVKSMAASTSTLGPSTRRSNDLDHRTHLLGLKMSHELLKMMKGHMSTMIKMAERDLAELGEDVEKDDQEQD
jgi:hypothetical protein